LEVKIYTNPFKKEEKKVEKKKSEKPKKEGENLCKE
jgi:hypothetical protein